MIWNLHEICCAVMCYYCSSIIGVMPDVQAVSSTEEEDKDCEYSVLKADAGCTPKLSRRKSVAIDCSRSVAEIVSKRSPSSSRRSGNSLSWLRAIKKSSMTAKHVVENRKKLCCSQVQRDTAPVNKVVQCGSCHPSADSLSLVISGVKSEAGNQYCKDQTTSSCAHVNVFDVLVQCTCLKGVQCTDVNKASSDKPKADSATKGLRKTK